MSKKENATPTGLAQLVTPAATHVTVFCNMPSGISFRMPDGRKVVFKGYPVSRLVGPEGEALPAGKYGTTRNVLVGDWDYIRAHYSQCSYFDPENPLLFAADAGAKGAAEGEAAARDLHTTRHGMEQVDVQNSQAVKTQPMQREE